MALPDFIGGGPLNAMAGALESRLRAFFPASHFDFGIVPARLTPQGWVRLVRRTPWVGLGWRGVVPDQASGRLFKGKAEWTVFSVVKNEHSPRARLLGDSRGPGQLGVAQVAMACLHGHELRDIGNIEVTGAANLVAEAWTDEAAEISGVNITVNFTLAGFVDLEDFLRLGATWEFDPSGTEGPDDLIDVRA